MIRTTKFLLGLLYACQFALVPSLHQLSNLAPESCQEFADVSFVGDCDGPCGNAEHHHHRPAHESHCTFCQAGQTLGLLVQFFTQEARFTTEAQALIVSQLGGTSTSVRTPGLRAPPLNLLP